MYKSKLKLKAFTAASIFLLGSFSGVISAEARPISYPGGWTILETRDGDSTSLATTYTLTKDYALGYRGEYFEDEKWQLHAATFDYLIVKNNMPAAQANLYLKSGIGFAHSDFEAFDGKNEAAGFTGIQADWENRRFMVKYENKLTYAGDIDKSFKQNVMGGVAPYLGNYGDLHTWLMLDVSHTPDMEDKFTFTPNVMFFKGNSLFEIGISNNMDLMLNTVLRF